MSDELRLQVARIAAGEFVMGAEDGEEDERPLHRAYVDGFAIGAYPVTNAEYAEFIHETGHASPGIRALPMMVSGALETDFRSLASAYFWNNSTPPEGRERHPVTLVVFAVFGAHDEFASGDSRHLQPQFVSHLLWVECT